MGCCCCSNLNLCYCLYTAGYYQLVPAACYHIDAQLNVLRLRVLYTRQAGRQLPAAVVCSLLKLGARLQSWFIVSTLYYHMAKLWYLLLLLLCLLFSIFWFVFFSQRPRFLICRKFYFILFHFILCFFFFCLLSSFISI